MEHVPGQDGAAQMPVQLGRGWSARGQTDRQLLSVRPGRVRAPVRPLPRPLCAVRAVSPALPRLHCALPPVQPRRTPGLRQGLAEGPHRVRHWLRLPLSQAVITALIVD